VGPKREHPTLKDVDRQQRQKFIDEELFWTGEITRRRIADAFGVSEETAKADLRAYRRAWAPDLTPDAQDNVYRVPLEFEPRLMGRPDPVAWLERQRESAAPQVPVDTVPDVERRAIDPTILQGIVRAIRGPHEVTVYYRSPKASEAKPYRVAPHALLHDGFRWSVRCYTRRGNSGYWGELVLAVIRRGRLTPVEG
jgi:predicted DNA-binding transcriptional regulator YafY